jgi:hypothetical protein
MELIKLLKIFRIYLKQEEKLLNGQLDYLNIFH